MSYTVYPWNPHSWMSLDPWGQPTLIIELKNYKKEIQTCISDTSASNLALLEIAIDQVDKILPFCLNVHTVELSQDMVFRIGMRRNRMFCHIYVERDKICISWAIDYKWVHLSSPHSDGFDKFLELFSQTPFYKRPEFIKVAARYDSV
jgi:hypothetical protein